ncbi:MAG: hypothetical protein QXP77_00355 [Candidatus Aenigmatarchaeota archaeon]
MFTLIRGKYKNIFIEINKKGILYSFGENKTLFIDWESIKDIGWASEPKFLGINLKDSSVVEEAYSKSKSEFLKSIMLASIDLAKSMSGYDVCIPDIFDLEKINSLILKYWKNPELRKNLAD